MNHRIILAGILLAGLVILFRPNAYSAEKDSLSPVYMIYVGYGFHWPGGDLSERFGPNSSIGAGFEYKSSRNFLWGIEGSFLFSENVREDDILQQIQTDQGYVIDIGGTYADVFLSQRGLNVTARLGKMIPVTQKNRNSGIFISAGGGLVQHRIHIVNRGNTAPQLDDEYKKGYDRLTNGFALTEFVGYKHLSVNRVLSFYAGLEFTQAFTQSRRDINFDTMMADDAKRVDQFMGFKIGWIFPLYGRQPKSYYYY